MKVKRIKSGLFLVFIALIMLLAVIIGGRGMYSAFADITEYSDALTDLQKDSSFKASDYPDNANDYSLQVIQIAESTGGELFIYTYQPCQNSFYLVATELNMSLSESVNGSKLYGLTLLNASGVFVKYKVTVVKVSSVAKRYYNITSIYRDWIKGVDEPTGNDNIKNAVSFDVGKCYKAITENGKIIYSCENRETIEILNPWSGFIRYNDGFLFHVTACDSHFVAFNTDIKIDTLYEADLEYKTRSVHEYYKAFNGIVKDYGALETKYAYLTDDQRYTEKATGWLWGQDRDYNRIQSVSDFIKGENLSEEAKAKLKGKQWVLRFTETDFTEVPDPIIGSVHGDKNYTEVSNVSILRLKFKSEGKVYNLGAVSDKVTGDDIPDNENPNNKGGFFAYVWNCITKLFTGKANIWESIVAVVVLIVMVVIVVVAIKFIRFVSKCLFG